LDRERPARVFAETHVAFSAPNRAAVDAFYVAATAAGAEVLHEPRLWPEYHENYYGVFVRDPTAITSKPSVTYPSDSTRQKCAVAQREWNRFLNGSLTPPLPVTNMYSIDSSTRNTLKVLSISWTSTTALEPCWGPGRERRAQHP